MPLPWVKLHVEIVDDPKLAEFTDGEWRFLVSMICLAKNSRPPGVVSLSADRISWRLRKDRAWVDAGLRACIDAGIMAATAEGFTMPKFVERQSPRKPEKPGAAAARMRLHRKRRGAA